MRRKRLVVYGNRSAHHLFSRVCGKLKLLTDAFKEDIIRILHEEVTFHGMILLGFVILDNHFHISVIAPERVPIDDEELLRRYEAKYGELGSVDLGPTSALRRVLAANDERAQQVREKLWKRMGTIPNFMKDFKQRVTQHYNTLYDHTGTIWESRYNHCMVENNPVYDRILAAYIDLNPVRAGIVDDPAHYRFGSYHAALNGNRQLRKAYERMYGGLDWEEAKTLHRVAMARRFHRRRPDRRGLTHEREAVIDELIQGGCLEPEVIFSAVDMRCMRDGQILGSPEFIRELTDELDGLIPEDRKTLCYHQKAIASEQPLYSVRKHRSRLFEEY